MRLCSTWWDAEGELTPETVDEILLGLSSQISEREDPVLCSDVRNNLFGPMEFSRWVLYTGVISFWYLTTKGDQRSWTRKVSDLFYK